MERKSCKLNTSFLWNGITSGDSTPQARRFEVRVLVSNSEVVLISSQHDSSQNVFFVGIQAEIKITLGLGCLRKNFSTLLPNNQLFTFPYLILKVGKSLC